MLRAMSRTHTNNTTNLDTVQKRFSQADIYDSLLSNKVLADILFKGLMISQEIRESINKSQYYVDVTKEPAWSTVWHAREREESAVNDAFTEMERQFENHEILDKGVILHVTGIRLWLSDIGMLSISRETVIQESKDYIEHLYNNKLLSELNHRSFDNQSYGGLCYFEYESSDFREISDILETRRLQVVTDLYPEKAEILLQEMETDTALFFRRLSWTNSEENLYANTPILSCVCPVDFTRRVMRLKTNDISKIIMALHARYTNGYLQGPLAAEADWIKSVNKELHKAIAGLTPVGKWAISSTLKHYLDTLTGHATP